VTSLNSPPVLLSPMSALQHITDSKSDIAPSPKPSTEAEVTPLFDYLVGGGEQRRRHGEAEGFRGLEVDHQFELLRSLDGQLARLLAFKDAIGIDCRAPEIIEYFTSIGEQAADFNKVP
jgi:hypothetical protein